MSDGVEFGVEVAHVAGEIVLAVRGEVDLATGAAFRAALETNEGEGRSLVLDLSAVSFMDSTGLNLIAETLVRQQRSGGSLCIRNPRGHVHRILEISGFDHLVTIDETVDQTPD